MTSYTKQTGWREFLELCQKAKSIELLDKVLRLHLTDEEVDAVATRYLIVRELLKGEKTQRDMSKALHISIAKITRGSNTLKTIDSKLRRLLLEDTDDGEDI